MRLRRASFEIWDWTDPIAHIERCGRVCYQSEPKGEPGDLVRKLIAKGHESVLEHVWLAAIGYGEAVCSWWPYLEWNPENNTVYGNVRAWRDFSNKAGHGLPPCLTEKLPSLFGDCLRTEIPFTAIRLAPEYAITVSFVVDRGVSHELVRHRPVSYSQESTRYCNYSGGVEFIIPPWVKAIEPGDYGETGLLRTGILHGDDEWLRSVAWSEDRYLNLLQDGWTPQQARSVLPNSLKTQIVTTATMEEWLHIFRLRTANAAHPQMREVMRPLCREFQRRFPGKFDEVKWEE